MLHKNRWPHLQWIARTFRKVLAVIALAFVLSFFLSLSHASAHTISTSSNEPTFQVTAGFDGRARDGNWIPVQITLRNDGPDFSGTISIRTSNAQANGVFPGVPISPSSYQKPITLPNGAQKQVTLYVPLYYGMQSVIVNLLNSNGNLVQSQVTNVNLINSGDIFVGILSDSTTGFGPLSAVSLPNSGGSVITEFLTASTLPAIADVLKNFNFIVLDNFSTRTLSQNQIFALQTWVNEGGVVLAVGGPEWQRTLSALPPSLLPVTANGTTMLPPGTSILPVGSSGAQNSDSDELQSAVTISTATTASGTALSYTETVLASGTVPLIVQAHHGKGSICYLALDPTLEPIVGWTGASTLWKDLLLRTLGDNAFASQFSSGYLQVAPPFSIDSLLQTLLPNTIPSPWLLAVLLIGYLVVLGPVRFLFVRSHKRRDWNWRIILGSIAVFSLLTYGLALHEKGTSILSNSISIVQLSQDGSTEHTTTYLGVFVPNQGNFQVHVPGNGLVQPSPNDYYSGSFNGNGGQTDTTITPVGDGFDVNLLGVNTWTLHSVVSEQDHPMSGRIVSHLVLQNSTLTGTVTNTLGYSLRDVYVLMPNSYVGIGNLAPGQTQQVNLSLNNATSNAVTGPAITLASQIASANGLPPYYYEYSNGPQETETQRHIEILTALSGTGYYGGPCTGLCSMPLGASGSSVAVVSGKATGSSSSAVSPSTVRANIAPAPGGPPISIPPQSDPLLVAGAPATLIGWATNANPGNVTVNGNTPDGQQETLIQAPLNVNFSGTVSLPSSLIPGQVIDATGNNIQFVGPGIYTMSTGSITFEFVLPSIANLQISNLAITEPANLTQIVSSASGTSTDGGQIATLYNWHTRGWDSIALSSSGITISNTNAYIGPGGRILVQFANSDSSLNTVVIGKPQLSVQGMIGNP